MELRFLRWVLLLLFLTIVATEAARGPAAKTDHEKSTPARARGSSRFNSKSATSTEAVTPETSLPSSDATITKTSRRIPGARRTSPSRSGTQTTSTVKTAVEKTSANPDNGPDIQSKSKINHHGLSRFASRKLVSKVQKAEPEKNVNGDSKDNSQDISEKNFLSESVTENARTGRARDLVESVEKVTVTDRTGNRRSSRLQNDRSKSNLNNSGPSVFTGTADNSRSRTGRKIQNSSVKQSNSGTQSSPRYARNQRIDDSNPNLGVGSNRRSFVHDPSDFRKKMTESRLKHDITASGSESVRFNLPLNFEEPRRRLSSGSSASSGPTTEASKRPTNSRYKSRGRQPLNERRQGSETTTSNPASRGTSRRTGNSRGHESTTESRGRNRGQDVRKNNIADSISTTVQPDFRRRNSNTKATARSFDTSRGFDNNRVSEVKSQNSDRKSNRSRGRYRVEVITTDSPSRPSATFAPRGPSVVAIGSIGNITPTSAPEVVTTLPPPTSSRASVSTTTRSSSNDNRRNDNESAQQNDQRRRASKEDFFNHGLGFRGRRPPVSGVDQVPVTVTSTTTIAPSTVAPVRPTDNSLRGNPGWTLRRRPGHIHDGPLSGPASNPAVTPIPGQQDNRVTTASTLPKTGRRGNKTNTKASGRTKDIINENDNYPPDFKARLAQLQKTGEQARTQEANKTTSIEQFAARSKMKLENARKLIKPELAIDETSARQVIVDPSPSFKEDTDQKPSDSAVDEDQKVFKVTRKSSPATEKPESGQKSSTKSDWKPSKLRKNFKSTQTRASRYKQLYTPRSKASLLASTTTERNFIEDNSIDSTTQSARIDRYKEHKFKFVPKVRGNKVRGPKPSHENSIHEDITNSTTKSPLAEKPRKTFAPRKNDKSHVDDIKAVALKLRKTLESMEKSQTPRPVRRSDSLEGSTTLLTTMRTVKSFSFSTRLVKMDDTEAATSSTMKMLEDEVTSTTESTSTTFMPTTTSLPMTTEITTQSTADNEITTSNYENVLASSNRPSTDDIANEIDNVGAFSTTEFSFKSTESPEFDWKTASTDSPPIFVDYKPRAAALSNDSGSPVFVVYPSATEKPLSIAITPKIQRYQATVKPDEANQGQQSVTQDPVISVKVSSGNETAEISIQDSNNGNSGNIAGSNIFNPVASAAILESGNTTLLEHLRSTVAPLLNTLGNKSPVFSGVYKNTNSANSLPRVTPSGAPPRFSARYRGAELFVRRPTPPTTLNSLTENEDASRPIDVSSPGEPKVLTFYQAVETASVNNEQTDVRQLWQLARGALVKNNTANDLYGTNGPNSDSPSIIPVTNTFNDISPVYINNASTHNVPDTTNTPDTTMNTTTHKTTQSLNDNPTEASSENQLKETTTTAASTTSDSISILSRLEDIDPTTESTTSPNALLMTEVSVAISKNVDENKVITTTSPSSSPSSPDSVSSNTNKPESSTSEFITVTSSMPESSTEIPSTSMAFSSSETTAISMTGTLAVNEITQALNSRTAKNLDDSNSGPAEGSTPSTAQRTAGTTTTIRPNQTFTTSSPTTTPPSSSVSSSTSENSNDQFFNNQPTPMPTTTTIPTITPTLPSSTLAPSTTSSPADYPINKQQPTMPVSFVGRSGFNKQPVVNSDAISSTTAPVRDYHIYGILPNKTIVRKRPEDNLIDARNVDSPYVIFGIFPDGKLVRKFPNGTVIPDPPSNPVEVVFSLSTTTNRPSLPDNQFINQESRNKNFDYFNNHSPTADVNTRNAFYEPNEVDNALSISGPTGFNLPLISVGSGTKKMTATIANDVTLDNNGQGGRIIQDTIKNEASKTSESNGQRNSVFVGQEKFVNYWTNGQPTSNPTVLSVNLTSIATATKEGPLSAPPEAINLDIIPSSQSANRVTAPPGFPWKDPLDVIFGIPSDSPALKESQTLNAINEAKKPTTPIDGLTIDNLVEIFNPISSTISSLINTPTKPTTTTTTITTAAPTSQTPATTTSTTQVSTTSRPIFPSTTDSLITMNPNLFGTKFEDLAFLNALLEKPNPGEATPKTLSEVERLLANKILSLALGKGLPDGGPTRSPKAIHPSNASPNTLTGDKDFKFTSSTPSFTSSSSQPIVIDLSTTTKIASTIPSTSTTWKTVQAVKDFSTSPTNKIITSTSTTTSTTTPSTTTTSTTPRTTTTSTTPRTTTQPTTKAPVIITAKSVPPRRPRPTTQAPPTGPFAFAANLLQQIFGRNPFAPLTTPRPVVRRPVATARRVPPTTRATTTTTPSTTTSSTTTTTTTTTRAPHIVLAQSSHTPRSIRTGDSAVDIAGGQSVVVTNTMANTEKPVEVTPRATKPSTSTFSPEEDAKFLAALLELARNTNGDALKPTTSAPKPALDADDEAFLRAILTDQAKIQPLSTAGGNDQNDAALLAAFLKSQGIEPSTPPNSLNQLLHQASKTTSTTTRRPTITTTTTRRTLPRRPPASPVGGFPSAYPPPLFSNFGALSGGVGATTNTNGAAEGNVRSQVVDAAIGMTRAFGQFLGAAITGAAQQFQSFIRNGTRWG